MTSRLSEKVPERSGACSVGPSRNTIQNVGKKQKKIYVFSFKFLHLVVWPLSNVSLELLTKELLKPIVTFCVIMDSSSVFHKFHFIPFRLKDEEQNKVSARPFCFFFNK